MRVSLVALAVVVATVAGSADAGAADPFPQYDGAMQFPAIHGPSDPEEFTWRVELGATQELQQVDDLHAEVVYESGHEAFTVTAERAHSAVTGAEVPTTLVVSEGDLITLVVHHRAGNPAAGGAPYDYPIVSGSGFEPSYTPAIVIVPSHADETGQGPGSKKPEPCRKGLRRVWLHGKATCRRIRHRLHRGHTLAPT